ncbi:hypothetical protein PQX77_016162 [Marasmius sp. AFHP31]|nr:hypothetical protein PQX77_016162 [Marasmius sp. AFHP31]
MDAVVAILFALVFACTVLNGQILHFYFLKNFGNYIGVTRIAEEVSAFTLITMLVTFIADLCFASRVWRLRRVHISIIALIVLTALAALISGAVLIDELLKVPLIVTLANTKHKTAVAVINIMAALSQMIATFALWYSFRTHMNEIANMPQSIFQRLSLSVVIRGTVLTIAQLLIVILYLVRPDRMWWAPIHQVLAPVYYMTTIATLNIRGKPTTQTQTDFPMIQKLNRSDSILGTRLSPTSPTAGSLDPFASNQRPTPFTDLHPTDSRTSGKRGLPQAAAGYNHRNDLQAPQDWTPQQISNELSTSSPRGSYPTLNATPSHSNSDLGRSPSLSTSSAKGKEKQQSAEPAESEDSGRRLSRAVRVLPPVPSSVVVNQ